MGTELELKVLWGSRSLRPPGGQGEPQSRGPTVSKPSQPSLLGYTRAMARSILLFVVAAVAEIGGAWLVWQGVRERRGLLFIAVGVAALGAYGFVATLQPSGHFGRVLAAYGGIFVAGSLLWGVMIDGFRPDRYDVVGACVCLFGVAVIMYGPRD